MSESILHTMMMAFDGLPGAPGRAVGRVYQWVARPAVTRSSGDPMQRLQEAFAIAEARLTAAITTADSTLGPLLEAQKLMLGDPELLDGALTLAQAGRDPAQAITTVAGQLAAVLEGADSDYFRERAIDVRAVGAMVAEALSGAEARAIPPGSVVLAEELSPLDTAQLAEAGVAALVTLRGGPTCHAAIIARAWGIPAVVGAPAEVLTIPGDTTLLVDGDTGRVTVNPSADALALSQEAALTVHIERRIPIYANVGSLAEAERALERGAEGIGLLRTEFLFQDRAEAPSEEEQVAHYTTVLRLMANRPVVIRTLDIGADKPVPFLPVPPEPNPQLGVRGIRLCLRERTLFVTQLRALLRAAQSGPLKIMLPMVTTADEVRAVRAWLDELAEAMDMAVPPLGVMIEVPMAALAAGELAQVCDFFSLGTNDLLQFLLAADRQNAGVGALHAMDHPAVWPLIAHVVNAAHATGIPVGICGEWAADPVKLARLIDLHIDTASIAVGALTRIRRLFPA